MLSFDSERAKVIRGAIELNLYGGPYKLLASRIYDYIDRFKKAPGEHVADLIQDKLEKADRESSLYADILQAMHGASKGINAEYVMSQLETFVKRQGIRTLVIGLQQLAQRDTEQSLEEAEKLLASSKVTQLKLFDPGTRLSDKKRALKFLTTSQEAFRLGIPELDKRGFGPTRKELWLGIGNTKAGKTWMLIQLAKMAVQSEHLRVCHVTLEMSEDRCAQRYFQALFAISKRKEVLKATRFKRDSLGRIDGLDSISLNPRLYLDDPNIDTKLEKLIDKWGTRLLDNILIKQFPTGSLTVRTLVSYLDNLEATERYVPDLLIIDYPDLMKLPKDNYRLAIDEAYKEIRGIAVARNIAVAVVSQSHRGAAKAKQVGAENVAEAYSKISHADTILTYTQTEGEASLGLARLYVAGGRNDADKCSIVISQQYGTGAFVIDSNLMIGNYWGHIPGGES